MSPFITAEDRERAQAQLQPGEKLLWCAKPTPTGLMGYTRVRLILGSALMAVFFLGFFLSPEGRFFFNSIEGCLVVAFILLPEVAICTILPLVTYHQMTRWLYVLTSRRALMLKHHAVKAWDIAPHMVKEYRPGKLGSIVLGYERIYGNSSQKAREEGFLRCREAAEAMHLLEQMLGGQALPHIATPEEQARMAEVFNHAQDRLVASSPGFAAGACIGCFAGIGGIISTPWWWGALPLPAGIFALIMAACIILISGAILRSYFRGKKLISQQKESS